MRALTVMLLTGSALALVAAPAAAQVSPPPETGESAQPTNADEDIIITARRQEERLIDVPASVTVLTGQTLSRADVENAEDFVQLTPGVTIVTGTAEAGDTQINIRGINGARDAESSVALVVDGILKTNTAQLNQKQGTLRQIEILKGPQGAIYGRNAAAGAIVVSTLRPGDALEVGLEASYASENTIEGTAYVATPLGDGIGAVLSGYYRTTDGFYRNLLTDRKTVDDQEIWSIDGRVVAQLGDATELDVKARYADLTGASINFNAAFHLPNFAAVNPAFFEDIDDHPFRYYPNIRPTNEQQTLEVSAKIDHELSDDLRLTAWALYSDVDQAFVADGTSADFARYITGIATPDSQAALAQCFATTAALTGFPVNQPGFIGQIPVPFIFAPATGSTFGPYSPTACDGTQYQVRNQEDYSGEIRLASTGDGPLSWQLGAYYLHIERFVGINLAADLGNGVIEEIYNAPGSGNPTSQLFADRFTTDVYAAFGSINYEISDRFRAGVALRYDIEDRSVSNEVPLVSDPITGGPLNPGQAFGAIEDQSATFKQLQPKVELSWRPTPVTNIYANWGIGFKAGGFNNQGSQAIVDQNFNQFINAGVTINDQYDKERSSAFEAGIKTSMFDGRLSFDLAGYYTDVKDMQFFEFFVGGFGLLRVVSNIDKVEVYGGELNVTARIVDGWTLFGAVNVTESEIKANSSRPYTVGNKSPHTADYTINLGSQMEVPVSDGIDVVMRADYRITGPTYFHTVQDEELPTLFSGLLPISALMLPGFVGNGRFDVTRRDAFGILNLRAGLEGESWSVTAFAENLLDRKFVAEAITAVEFGGSFISPGPRRLIGVEVGYRF